MPTGFNRRYQSPPIFVSSSTLSDPNPTGIVAWHRGSALFLILVGRSLDRLHPPDHFRYCHTLRKLGNLLLLHNLLVILARVSMRDIRLRLMSEITMGNLRHIRIVLDVQIASFLLGSDKRQQDCVRIYTAHKDTND